MKFASGCLAITPLRGLTEKLSSLSLLMKVLQEFCLRVHNVSSPEL